MRFPRQWNPRRMAPPHASASEADPDISRTAASSSKPSGMCLANLVSEPFPWGFSAELKAVSRATGITLMKLEAATTDCAYAFRPFSPRLRGHEAQEPPLHWDAAFIRSGGLCSVLSIDNQRGSEHIAPDSSQCVCATRCTFAAKGPAVWPFVMRSYYGLVFADVSRIRTIGDA